jgi:hypothetical protein
MTQSPVILVLSVVMFASFAVGSARPPRQARPLSRWVCSAGSGHVLFIRTRRIGGRPRFPIPLAAVDVPVGPWTGQVSGDAGRSGSRSALVGSRRRFRPAGLARSFCRLARGEAWTLPVGGAPLDTGQDVLARGSGAAERAVVAVTGFSTAPGVRRECRDAR